MDEQLDETEQREPVKYSKVIVAGCIITIIVFCAAVLFISFKGGHVQDSLVYCMFGMFGIELASCAGITITKVKKGMETPQISEVKK